MQENKPVEACVYDKHYSNRFVASALLINRKRLDFRMRGRESGVSKRVRKAGLQANLLFSAAPGVLIENVFREIVMYYAENLVVETDTVIHECALLKHCRIFQCMFQKLLDHFEQCGCDIEIKTIFDLTHPPYNIHQELERQASNHKLFDKGNIAGMVDMCDEDLNLSRHVHIFCS